MDRNRDGFLSIDECAFDSDLKKQPREVVFRILDQNGDERIASEELLARIRPRKMDDRAQRYFQRRSAEIEDAFLASDLNRDQVLSLEEFDRPDSPVFSTMVGGNFPRPEVRLARSFSAGPMISWRIMGLVIANVFILAGVVWWYLRR
jgi:hypothetical protein